MNLSDRLLIIVASALEAAPKFKKIGSKLGDDESAHVREVILPGVSRIEREEATRSDVSRAREGALVEVWM